MKRIAIPEPKPAKEAMKKIRGPYRRLIENSPDILYTLTKEGVFGFVSPAWTVLLGHPVTQVIGKPFLQFVHPDDLELYRSFLQRVIDTGQWQRGVEFRVQHADGSWRWLMINAIPQKNKAGKIVGFEGLASDMTDRKPAEEARRESEERAQIIFENMRDTAWLMDSNFKTTWISPSAVRTRGFKIEELRGSTLDRHMTPASLARMMELTAKQLSPANLADKSREIIIGGEFEFYRKDGTTFLGDTVTTLLRDSHGTPSGFLCVVRDVTERKLAEKALLVSEARYRKLVENANESIVVAQDGLLKFVNRAAIKMIGYSESELISKPFVQFIHPDDRETVEDHHRRRIAGETDQPRYVFRVQPRDGGLKWVEIGAVMIEWEGRSATLNFLSDITDRHQAEETIRASLREKEVMLREIHHRVKNNMQVISSLFNLQSGHTLDQECREILKEAQTRIRAMSLVHEKLYKSNDLSRIDLAAYIQSLAVHLFQVYLLDSDQVRLETDFEEVPLDINSAVPCGLILNELISNAIKHAFPGHRKGSIRIELKRGSDGTIVLRVADDGIGFPKNLDFSRAESFGLQIVNLLVGQLEATIDLDWTNGTAFTVTFREPIYTPRI